MSHQSPVWPFPLCGEGKQTQGYDGDEKARSCDSLTELVIYKTSTRDVFVSKIFVFFLGIGGRSSKDHTELQGGVGGAE